MIIILSLGLNDSLYLHDQKSFLNSIEEYQANLGKIINIAKQYAEKIFFVGFSPVNESKTDPISWNANETFKNDYIEEYQQMAKNICQEQKIPFIDIWQPFLDCDYQKLLADGLHPNPDGHQKIFELVKDSLVKNKII